MDTAESFYGIGIESTAGSAVSSTDDLLAVVELLKPQRSARSLIRIGADVDGSYLVPDDLDEVSACFSPGVNKIKYFEDYLTEHYGVVSHMCDFSCDVNQLKTPLIDGKQTFAKKWLDPAPGEDNLSLQDWIDTYDPRGDLILQMDIEGAEYRNLLATSTETLRRFRMIVLEVHGLGKMLDADVLAQVIGPFFRRLGETFTTVHAHPNNCCGDFVVPGTDVRVPNLLELTLVRNDHFEPADGPPSLPHPLDVSFNVPRRPPLFLSESWCDHQRPLESRVKMLEDLQRFRDEVGGSSSEVALAGALTLAMQSVQTVRQLSATTPPRTAGLVEVAAGSPYTLSSSFHGRTSGLVAPRGDYFFHTGFGAGQWIRVDLGQVRRVRRIEISNRRGGYQQRARHVFAVLSHRADHAGRQQVFPIVENGSLPEGAWQEAALDLRDVPARYITINSPLNTALHFADLRIYAAETADRIGESRPPWTVRRVARGVRRRLGRLRRWVRTHRPPERPRVRGR